MKKALMLAGLIVIVVVAAFAFSERGRDDAPGRPSPHAIDQSP
ncbi:hypothetical protein SAMN05880582_104214 [Rhizobium sp. RU20A]|nr:hypothetical protein [Rhizobium sp. RU20A]SIQ89714.1 hypothetical protein SAMN05880582_104214 [Rhizobium sp. RU20A]